jgi:membrane-bound lytic murein transglycosylase B
MMKNLIRFLKCSLIVALLSITTISFAEKQPPLSQRTDVNAFIQEMVKDYNFNEQQLTTLFNQAHINARAIELTTTPYEAKPWFTYRKHFITQARIDNGVIFWHKYHEQFQTVSERTGIPPEILVAIVGVETHYGKERGSFSAMDALTSLAFDFPRRAAFFRKELREYLLLCREQGWDPLTIKGSYAGALGQPQFMPSSYRYYAVSYDGKSKPNLFNNENDVIASIGNYFKKHGWQKDQPIAVIAVVKGDKFNTLPPQDKDGKIIKPTLSLQEFANYNVTPMTPQASDLNAILMPFQLEDSNQYWFGFTNFYMITRYNTSKLYALAVYQLAEEIKTAYNTKYPG